MTKPVPLPALKLPDTSLTPADRIGPVEVFGRFRGQDVGSGAIMNARLNQIAMNTH